MLGRIPVIKFRIKSALYIIIVIIHKRNEILKRFRNVKYILWNNSHIRRSSGNQIVNKTGLSTD